MFSSKEIEVDQMIQYGKTVIDLTHFLGGSHIDLEENFKSFLVFLYTGRIDLTRKNVNCFKEIAEQFLCDILRKSILTFEAENVKAFKCKTEVENLKKTEIRLKENKCKNQRLNDTTYPTKKKTESMDTCNEKNKKKQVITESTESSGEKCDKNLLNLSFTDHELKAHKKKTQLTKMFSCNICDQAFIHVNKFLKHIDKYKHIDINCSICDFKGESQLDLINHLECHRTPGKPYHCQFCSMKFRSKRELTVHLPKHSDTFGYICNICDKGFKWKQVLKVHMSTHSETDTLLCSTCGFSTKHKSTMETHQNRHIGKDFACTIPGCSFKTARKQNLKQHIKNHNNEQSYNCTECDKSFSQKKNLTRHQAFHEKSQVPLECPAKDAGCSYTNHRKDKLAHHISAKHIELVRKDDKENVEIWFENIHETSRKDMPQTVEDICLECLDDTVDENTITEVDPINNKHNPNDLNSTVKHDTRSETISFAPNQSGICLDPIKYVNPPNKTVTQSLATCPTTTPPMNMASTMASISSSFLQGFM